MIRIASGEDLRALLLDVLELQHFRRSVSRADCCSH